MMIKMPSSLGENEVKNGQRLRLHRFRLSVITYSVAILATYLITLTGLGTLNNEQWVILIGLCLSGISFFYFMFHTRANLRFSEPSLTREQIAFSAIVGVVIMYWLPEARPIILLFFLPPFSFGMLSLTFRQYLVVVAWMLGAYAALLGFEISQNLPGYNLKYQLYLFVLFSLLLVWFASFGGFVSKIKRRLKAQKKETQKALELIKIEVEERKQAERALAESDSLRELLLDIITHDLRNPAGVIYALSETAQREMPENAILKGIYTSSGRLIEILAQTTILSQAAFGEMIPKESLSLNALIKETADEFSSTLSKAGMELVVAIAPDIIIHANPLIAEVFKNYISNAIKYARDGGKIVIETVIEDQTVMVSVKDFGETIAKADRDQIFQRRVQLENGKERGRGLGLAIVKRIAQAHAGEAWVEPNTPAGNSFCIRIPL